MSFANHGLSADILAKAKDLIEGKTKDEEFVIPEDINKEDVGDFVVAAAAAKKAGKKEFEFGGKKFPVTIKTDIKTEEKDEDDDTEGKVKNDIEVDPELEEEVKDEDEEETVDEASDKEVKMAIGIASDKRYAGGNMSGAVKAIEKIKKGLSKHKQVAAVLKRQNEETLDELKQPFVVYDTADGNNVVGMASDEKGAKSIISTSQLPPMKIKDKKTLKIAKVKKAHKIGQELKETGVAGGQYSPIKKFDSPKHEDDVETIDNLPEGAMKKFHQMMDDGASAADIAKELKIDVKVVKKLMKEDKQFHPDHFLAIKEVFEDFMVEGTMAHGIFSRDKAQAQAAMDALKDLMRKKLPVGRDGSSSAVEDKVYDIVFDDQLFDDFDELRDEKGDNADARPLIRARLKQLRVKV